MTTTPFEAASRLAAEANINANGRKPTGGKRFEPATNAKRMIEEGLIVAKGGGQLFMYDPAPGTYVAAEARLLETLAKRLDTEWQPSRADAVVRYLFDTAQILWERPPLDKVNVSNGILDIASGDLEPHNPEYLTYVQIPVAWRPRADCPRVRQFVDEVFPFDAPVLAYEVAGCLLVPDLRFQRSVLLLGAGQNGKGVFLRLLIAMLGKQNVSRVSLKELADDRFATADLHGKLANVFSDLPDTHIKDSSMFKVLTGDEGRIRAQRKHGQPFEFEPFARLVFSANRVPGSRDTTFGYLRRWLVVEFPNQFVGDANDRSLADKLTTKDELSGFLRFSVEYYRDCGFPHSEEIPTRCRARTRCPRSPVPR